MSSSKLTNIIDSFWNKCAGDQSYGHQSQFQWFSRLEAPNDPHKTVYTLMDQWYPRSRHCRTAILIHSDRHRQLKIHQTHTFFEKTLSNTWLIRRNIYYWGSKTCQIMILISDMHSNGFFAFECNPTAKKSEKTKQSVSNQSYKRISRCPDFVSTWIPRIPWYEAAIIIFSLSHSWINCFPLHLINHISHCCDFYASKSEIIRA